MALGLSENPIMLAAVNRGELLLLPAVAAAVVALGLAAFPEASPRQQ
jgi:hypothetical protein